MRRYNGQKKKASHAFLILLIPSSDDKRIFLLVFDSHLTFFYRVVRHLRKIKTHRNEVLPFFVC